MFQLVLSSLFFKLAFASSKLILSLTDPSSNYCLGYEYVGYGNVVNIRAVITLNPNNCLSFTALQPFTILTFDTYSNIQCIASTNNVQFECTMASSYGPVASSNVDITPQLNSNGVSDGFRLVSSSDSTQCLLSNFTSIGSSPVFMSNPYTNPMNGVNDCFTFNLVPFYPTASTSLSEITPTNGNDGGNGVVSDTSIIQPDATISPVPIYIPNSAHDSKPIILMMTILSMLLFV